MLTVGLVVVFVSLLEIIKGLCRINNTLVDIKEKLGEIAVNTCE